MESACIDFQVSYGWMIFIAVLVLCAPFGVWYWLRNQPNIGMDFFEGRPAGTDRWSVISWLFWTYAWISQLLPVGVLSRVIGARYSRLVLDLYIISWSVIMVITLLTPEHIAFFVPLFIWRFWEYTAIATYQRVFRSGFPPRLERRPEEFRLGYRALLVDAINYLTFIIMFAALYHAHGSKFNPQITNARDAVYFSVATMTTLGHGDIAP